MKSTAERFKCSHCATGQTPEGIFAGPNGIKKSDPKNALNKEEQVSQTEETPALGQVPDLVGSDGEPLIESEEPVSPKDDLVEPSGEEAKEPKSVEAEAEPMKKQRVAKRRLRRRRF